MATTLSLSINASVSGGGATVSSTASVNQTLTGANFQSTVQDVGASTEALVISAEIGAGGLVVVKNLTDDVGGTVVTPTMTLSTANPATSTTTLSVLLPGEAYIGKPGTTTLYGISSSGNCPTQVMVSEL